MTLSALKILTVSLVPMTLHRLLPLPEIKIEIKKINDLVYPFNNTITWVYHLRFI